MCGHACVGESGGQRAVWGPGVSPGQLAVQPINRDGCATFGGGEGLWEEASRWHWPVVLFHPPGGHGAAAWACGTKALSAAPRSCLSWK